MATTDNNIQNTQAANAAFAAKNANTFSTATPTTPTAPATPSPTNSIPGLQVNASDLTGGVSASGISSNSLTYPAPAATPNPSALVAGFATPSSAIVPPTPAEPNSFTLGDGRTYGLDGKEIQTPVPTKGTTGTSAAAATAIDSTSPTVTAAQTAEQQGLDTIHQATTALLGRGAAQTAADATYGVNANAEAAKQTATLLAQRTNAYRQATLDNLGNPNSIEVQTGRAALLQQQSALELGALSATLQAQLGNYTVSKDQADRVVAAQFDPYQKQIDNTKTFLDENFSFLTDQERVQAEKITNTLAEQQKTLDRQKDARTFALTNAVSKPFYSVGGTVYRTSDGAAASSPADYKALGGTGDFSDVQKVSASLEAGNLITTPDGAVYVKDSTSSTGVRLLIPGQGSYSVQQGIDGTFYSINNKNGHVSIAVDSSGAVVDNGTPGSLVTSHPDPSKVINGYDLTTYATNPAHVDGVRAAYNALPDITDAATAQAAIAKLAPSSKVTGDMVMQAASQYNVDPKLMIAAMQQDSNIATKGLGAKNNNPGNINASGTGSDKFATMQDGVNALANNLNERKISNSSTASTSIAANVDINSIHKVISAIAGSDPKVLGLLNRSAAQALQKGDLQGVQDAVLSGARDKMDSTTQQQVDGRVDLVQKLGTIQGLLDKYKAAGGDTNALTGSAQNIANKIGSTLGSGAAQIASDTMQALIVFRRANTGVAFSPEESAQYEALFPSLGKTYSLNSQLISSMVSSSQASNKVYYSQAMGGDNNYNALMNATGMAAQIGLEAKGITPSSTANSTGAGNIWDSFTGANAGSTDAAVPTQNNQPNQPTSQPNQPAISLSPLGQQVAHSKFVQGVIHPINTWEKLFK